MTDCDATSQETVEDFAARVGTIVSDGYVCLAIALGVDTGLFDVMISLGQPKTSQEIADAVTDLTGSLKRMKQWPKVKQVFGTADMFVRDWLGEMVTAKIISMDLANGTCWVPEDHRPSLQRGSKLSKAAISTLGVPTLSEAYHSVKECFKLDGPNGVPSEKYSQFDRSNSGRNEVWFSHFLIQSFIPSVPGLTERLEEGICVLDVCCGEGVATIIMAQHFPRSQFYAFDLCESAIRTAREKAVEAKLKNAHMLCCDAASLPAEWAGKFQYIFSRSGIHDQPHPRNGLTELSCVIADDGVMSIVEPACHSSLTGNLNLADVSSLYAFSMMSCLAVSLGCAGSDGLGAVWGQEAATSMLQECGFRVMSVTDVQGDLTVHLFCQKKEAKPVLSQSASRLPPNTLDSHDGMDPTKAEAFSSFIDDKGSSGLVSLAIAIGMDAGLFDVMISLSKPKTCQEIADAGKFKERYVREWIGAMVTSRIVNTNRSGEMFWIPDHRRPVLQKGGELCSAAMSAVSIPMLSQAFFSLVDCFKRDGPQGVNQDKYSHCCKYLPDEHSVWSKFLS